MLILPLLLTLPMTQIDFYIGTYTSDQGSKGIYHARLDTETGAISDLKLGMEAPNPSFLALHPNGKTLYAVHESTDGEVSAFRVGADKGLVHVNKQAAPGWGPCHLSVDPSGQVVMTASYGGGTLAAFPVRGDGSLASPSFQLRNTGSGPDKSRQEAPHMHSVYADAKSRFAYALDLGTDEILTFRLEAAKGKLTPTEPKSTKTPAGGGPRHLAIHPGGKFAFANNEMTSSVSAYSIDEESGQMKLLQSLSTLPEHGKTIRNSTAEIACHPSGKWLYVSNRGDDSFAVYAISATGTMTLVEIVSTTVREPRGFAIDPSGHWIVVGGQNSNELASLKLDPSTGRLTPSGSKVTIDKPVCVVFCP